MPALAVDPARMLADLDRLRQFGQQGTGVARMAFSGADIAARQWLAGRMEAAGLRAVVDACGNLFGLPPGDGPCLLVGSHSDTQPLGGWLDGAWGVICGLELARAACQAGGPRIAVVSFQEEEGRFGGLAGSAVWAGQMSLAEADAQRDADGVSFGEARKAAPAIAPFGTTAPEDFLAFIEPHIEQGPVLDTAGQAIGIVEAIVGVRSWELTFTGQANHAGTTPMGLRRDAVQALGQFIHELNTVFAPLVAPDTVWTLGRITVTPNAPSIVPGAASISVQMRDADPARLEAMKAAALDLAQRIGAARGLGVDAVPGLSLEPVPMDIALAGALAEGARLHAPGQWRRMPSGALHDASNVALHLPTAMLFVPSIGGISHNPDEDTARAHLQTGLLVLAEAAGRIMAAPQHNQRNP
ncbi:MAG: hydantoinase/carbamoylase family amidase [Pararhodobacter sp.]